MSSPAAAAAAAAASPLGVLGCLEGVLECCRAGRAGRRGTARAGAAAAERGLRAARVGAAVGGLRAADAERGLRAAAAASAIAAHAVRVCQAARVLLARGAQLRLCALCALCPRLHYRLLTCAPRPTDPVPRGQLWPTGPIYCLYKPIFSLYVAHISGGRGRERVSGNDDVVRNYTYIGMVDRCVPLQDIYISCAQGTSRSLPRPCSLFIVKWLKLLVF